MEIKQQLIKAVTRNLTIHHVNSLEDCHQMFTPQFKCNYCFVSIIL